MTDEDSADVDLDLLRESSREFLAERVFEPLGMADSGLSVPASKRHRFSTCYFPQANAGGKLAVWDEPDGRFAADPIFPNSIVSTAGDYVRFTSMLLGEGTFQGRRFLSPESVALMMTDHLSVATDKKINMEGPSGDTYMSYDSTKARLFLYVNGQKVAWFKD